MNTVNSPAGLLVGGTAITTLALTIFGDWIQASINIPVGVLLALFIFILVPTGEVIRLISLWVKRLEPNDKNDDTRNKP